MTAVLPCLFFPALVWAAVDNPLTGAWHEVTPAPGGSFDPAPARPDDARFRRPAAPAADSWAAPTGSVVLACWDGERDEWVYEWGDTEG